MTSRRSWGQAFALFDRSRKLSWVDLLVVIGLIGAFYGLLQLGSEWTGQYREAVEIDLSPRALPLYTFYSLCRGLIAYVISLGFTLVYGYWAAKDPLAERVLVPLLDILQSIPVLGFFPAVLLALIALFPNSNVGLELACVILIFTGQAWNMTFSFYRSVKSVPNDYREVSTVYRFSWWQRFRWVELPFSTIGLVWNSMMSMAGGWFFLSVCEASDLGERSFRVPGIGSYMTVASKAGRWDAMFYALVAMIVMILAVDQLLWRPIVVWAVKFRVEEGGDQEEPTSWFLNLLRRSHLLALAGGLLALIPAPRPAHPAVVHAKADPKSASTWLDRGVFVLFCILLLALAAAAWKLLTLLAEVGRPEWENIGLGATLSLGRVLAAMVVGTIIALPTGLAIGLSPRLSRIMQPIIQVVASFPAPMLFPIVLGLVLKILGITLGWGSIFLILLGTQWYILFNVIAGASAIPADLREMAASYRIAGWQRFRDLYFPGVFPYLVTGWVTAAGGAWNTTIVAEYVEYNGEKVATTGLGALISMASAARNIPLLAASAIVMSTIVVLFNRNVWRRLYRLAEERYSLNK